MASKIRKPLLDGLLIVFSVLFALFITSSYENYQTRKKTKIALQSISSEIDRNLDILEKWKTDHTEIRDKVSGIAYGANDSLSQVLSKFEYLNFGILTENKPLVNELLIFTAWETAKSTGLIAEFDFETAQKLTLAYELKRVITDSSLKTILDFYYSKEAHDMENLQQVMVQFSLRLYEISYQEESAIEVGRQALQHLSQIRR